MAKPLGLALPALSIDQPSSNSLLHRRSSHFVTTHRYSLNSLILRTTNHRDQEVEGSNPFAQNLQLSASCYFTAICFNAAAIPALTDSGLPVPQKCIKNRRGSSVSMWL